MRNGGASHHVPCGPGQGFRDLRRVSTARRRQVTPQRVSQLIRALERRVGGALFERISRRVELTELGGRLHADLQPHYRGIRDALDSAAASARGVGGTLRVGYMNALWGEILVEAAETMHTMQPGAQIMVREVLAGDALRPLRNGDVDVMCAGYPLDEADVTIGPVLLQEQALLVISQSSPK